MTEKHYFYLFINGFSHFNPKKEKPPLDKSIKVSYNIVCKISKSKNLSQGEKKTNDH